MSLRIFPLDFFPQIYSHARKLCNFISFLHEVAIGTRIVHTVARGTLCASLRTPFKSAICLIMFPKESVVLTPQPFLWVAFEEILGCSRTRHTSFDSPPCIFNVLGVSTCVCFDDAMPLHFLLQHHHSYPSRDEARRVQVNVLLQFSRGHN